MTLCADNDSDLKSLFVQMTEKYGSYEGEAAFVSFSRVLREMKKFDEAEKYCHRLLQEFSSNNVSLGTLYLELAEIAAGKNDSNLSDQWRKKAMEMEKKTESESFDNSIEANNNNGKSRYRYTNILFYFLGEDESSNSRDMIDPKSAVKVPDSTTSDQNPLENNFRFTDVLAEKHQILLPIEGHEKMPLVSLEEAVQPLLPILPDIRRKVHTAKLRCKNPADGLTPDQSAAIMLYTMEWEPQDQCLYFALNARLRAADRKLLKPWFLYLKLILTGLSRLPSIERTVYRGVKRDLSSTHYESQQFFWWGFSSCTTNMNVLKADEFLGNSGVRTFFLIDCVNGKDIRNHSYYEKEEEILLLPASYFQVASCLEMAPDLHAIQLKEITPEFPYLEPVV